MYYHLFYYFVWFLMRDAYHTQKQELIVNFQDVESLVDDLSKDLLALFVEVDNELVDVLVYAVREHFAVIPYSSQRNIKFTLRNLYRHETIGEANLRMSLFNNFEGSLEQVLYLDGYEKYRLESPGQPNTPFAVLVYEWRDEDPEPAKELYDEFRYAIEHARASHLETEDRMKEVELTFAYLARHSVENMLVRQRYINDFKEVTDKQHETSKLIFENLKEFSKIESEGHRKQTEDVNAELRKLEEQLRALEDELYKEKQSTKDYERDILNHAPIKTNPNLQRDRDGRYNIKEEVSRATADIADKTLKQANKAKEDALLWGLEQTNAKLALFDDILNAQEKSSEAKLKLDAVKAEIRGAQCELAKKEFDLQQLENESKALGQLDRDLAMRLREGDEALQAMLADRKDARDRGNELEARAKEYEELLAQIEAEVNALKAESEGRQDNSGKDLFQNSGHNNPEIKKLSKDLDDAERERNEALDKLEAMKGAWVESVEEVSTEAEHLAADNADDKFRKDVQALLKDILDASNRSADLYQTLETTDQQLTMYKIADDNELAKELAKDIEARNKRLGAEEESVITHINNGVTALEEKIQLVDNEQSQIPPLQAELERLLRERDELQALYEDLVRRKQERQDLEDERERQYQLELAAYERRIAEINKEIKKLQDQINECNNAIKNLKPQIEDLKEELETWVEKIRLKREIIRKKREEDELNNIYYADPNDPIDVKIGEYKANKVTLIPIKRIEPGEYMFATMRVHVEADKSQNSGYLVKVLRTGKKYDLHNFILNEANKELEKLEKIQEDQEIVVDESEKTEIRQSPGGRNSRTNSPSRDTAVRQSNVVTTDKISKYRR